MKNSIAIRNSAISLEVPYFEGPDIIHGSKCPDFDFPQMAIKGYYNDKVLISYIDTKSDTVQLYFNKQDVFSLPENIVFCCVTEDAFLELGKHFPIHSIDFKPNIYITSNFYYSTPEKFVRDGRQVHTLITVKDVLNVLSKYTLDIVKSTQMYNGDPMFLLNY